MSSGTGRPKPGGLRAVEVGALIGGAGGALADVRLCDTLGFWF